MARITFAEESMDMSTFMTYKPPQNVQNVAQMGQELRKRFGRGSSCSLSEMLSKGMGLQDHQISQLNQFFTDNISKCQPSVRESDGGPTAGTIDWMLRGGTTCREWVLGEVAKRRRDDKIVDVTVEKVDDELGVVFGFAIVCKQDGEDYYDTQGDHITEDAMLEATAAFMSGDRVAKLMHEGDQAGQVVYGFPLTSEIAKAHGIETGRTGFLVGMRPDSEEILDKFRKGALTGFSIGGRRVSETIVEE